MTTRRAGAWSVLAALYFAAMFFVVMPAGVLWLEGRSFAPPMDAVGLVALAVIVAANAAVARLVWRFVVEGRGTQVPIAPPRFLVRGGAYRRVRNPMYLCYLVTVGAEVALYRSPALALYALACTALAHGYVLHEERLLLRRFGDDYRAYLGAVPRWLPRLSSAARASASSSGHSASA